MKSDLKVCPQCSRDVRVRVSDDVGFYFHWVGDYFLIDVVLFFEGSRFLSVLYRDVYVVDSAV